jgi:hypothetical protein
MHDWRGFARRCGRNDTSGRVRPRVTALIDRARLPNDSPDVIALILKDEATAERVGEVLRELGLTLESTDPADEQFFRQIWMAADEKSAVQYHEDGFAKIRYLSVRGARVRPLAKQLRKALPIWMRDELLKHALFLLADGSDEARQRVAMEIACEMTEYDAASAGVLEAFLHMDEPSIRRAGARAFRTRPWPILEPTARRLAVDADPEIAAHGQAMLQRIFELHGE